MREETDTTTARRRRIRQQGDEQLARDATAAESSDTSAAPAIKAEIMESVSDPEFHLAMEVQYHGMRQHFLGAMHRWMMFLAIVFGASAATPIGGANLCGLCAAAAAAADMAFDFVGRAQVHADIKRRYFEMVADLARANGVMPDFPARWMVVSADEPPLFRRVSEMAKREACIQLERAIPAQLSLWDCLTAHFWRG